MARLAGVRDVPLTTHVPVVNVPEEICVTAPDTVKEPVATCTVPVLLNGQAMVVKPVPPVFLSVPALMRLPLLTSVMLASLVILSVPPAALVKTALYPRIRLLPPESSMVPRLRRPPPGLLLLPVILRLALLASAWRKEPAALVNVPPLPTSMTPLLH